VHHHGRRSLTIADGRIRADIVMLFSVKPMMCMNYNVGMTTAGSPSRNDRRPPVADARRIVWEHRHTGEQQVALHSSSLAG